ncbi:MAG: PHP domain-containing protein [Myxococcaceae bacterium]|nr:PHP domain-containing protein [Myxococcaceae bacterium]
MIDLHSHTTASDGQHAPAEQIAMAAKAGIGVLAVTDHDTVSGLDACEEAARAHGMRLVPGIEISVHFGGREVHILGHFVDRAVPKLGSFDVELKAFRERRMGLMVEKLASLGFPVTLADVKALAGNAHLARPHLARWLVEHGYCTSTQEAFTRFLGDGKPAAVARFDVTPDQAIELIHLAHGTATLAHPGPTRINHWELEQLKQRGLDGIEVHHSDHPPSQREQLLAWAKEFDLVPTAGSDFHGLKVAPDRRFGSVTMDPAELERLERRRR